MTLQTSSADQSNEKGVEAEFRALVRAQAPTLKYSPERDGWPARDTAHSSEGVPPGRVCPWVFGCWRS